MFNLFTLFRSVFRSPSRAAFDSSTAPSERIALEDGRSVRAYRFDGQRLLFDAEHDWRFMGSLPGNASRATIVSVAEAYFRGLAQGQGEWSELGLSDEFLAMAHEYEAEMARRPKA